jgi:hypothetical protein
MKVNQKSIVRWIAKRAAKRCAPTPTRFEEIPAASLKQVAGGTGASSQNPKGNW